MWPGERTARWAGPLLLTAVALAFDALNRHVEFGLLSTGPLDEAAHLATAALGLSVLACLVDAPRRFYVAALAAAVAIDLDHIPLYLGLLHDDGQRPVTHSLATVVVFAVAAALGRRHRAVLAGVAAGLVLHFARDVAEGPPGVRLFWPLDGQAWTAGYRWFLGMIIVFTAARLILVATGVPRARIRLFQQRPPARRRGGLRTDVGLRPGRLGRLDASVRGSVPEAAGGHFGLNQVAGSRGRLTGCDRAEGGRQWRNGLL